MKYYIIAIIILIAAFLLLFQMNKLPQKWQDYTEHIESDFKAYKFLEDLCLNVGGRISGTEKGKQAEDLVINYLKSFGYSDIFLHRFEHVGWERESCSLTILDEDGNIIKTVKTQSLGLTPEESNLKLPLVNLFSGAEKAYEKYPKGFIKNKIVLVDDKAPIADDIVHRADKVEYAEKNGASAFILYNSYFGNVISTGIASFGEYTNIPAISISREDGLYLAELLDSDKVLIAEINCINKNYATSSRNISIEVPGTEKKDEVIILSAHLDSWDLGQGAVDNGANVAILLELARQFKKLNITSKRTIRFMFFMAEEFGLIGSKNYLLENPDLIKDIFYVLNFEMNIKPIGINLFLKNKDKIWFEELAQQLSPLGLQKNSISHLWLESDHTYFLLHRIPTLSFIDKFDIASKQNYHSKEDKIDLVKPEDLKKCVKLFGIILQEMANTDKLGKWRFTKTELESEIKNSKQDKIFNLRNIKYK